MVPCVLTACAIYADLMHAVPAPRRSRMQTYGTALQHARVRKCEKNGHRKHISGLTSSNDVRAARPRHSSSEAHDKCQCHVSCQFVV